MPGQSPLSLPIPPLHPPPGSETSRLPCPTGSTAVPAPRPLGWLHWHGDGVGMGGRDGQGRSTSPWLSLPLVCRWRWSGRSDGGGGVAVAWPDVRRSGCQGQKSRVAAARSDVRRSGCQARRPPHAVAWPVRRERRRSGRQARRPRPPLPQCDTVAAWPSRQHGRATYHRPLGRCHGTVTVSVWAATTCTGALSSPCCRYIWVTGGWWWPGRRRRWFLTCVGVGTSQR